MEFTAKITDLDRVLRLIPNAEKKTRTQPVDVQHSIVSNELRILSAEKIFLKWLHLPAGVLQTSPQSAWWSSCAARNPFACAESNFNVLWGRTEWSVSLLTAHPKTEIQRWLFGVIYPWRTRKEDAEGRRCLPRAILLANNYQIHVFFFNLEHNEAQPLFCFSHELQNFRFTHRLARKDRDHCCLCNNHST